jgi:hypothetical protein
MKAPLQVRIVRLVAGVAGHAAGMLRCGYLREIRRLSGVFLMAACAERGDFRKSGFDLGNVGDVCGLSTVARFAGHMSVLTGGTGFSFFLVALEALSLAGERDRVLADEVERAGPVVPVLSKVLWNYRAANHQKDAQPGQQNHRRADQMTGIPKEAHRGLPIRAATHIPEEFDDGFLALVALLNTKKQISFHRDTAIGAVDLHDVPTVAQRG